jgi:hypothetical protein
LPAHAVASSSQESVVMDDQHIEYAKSASHVVQTLQQLASLGVDRVKVSVVWVIVAPHARSKRRPKFDASNPDAYPKHAWDRYDLIVRTAYSLGMRMYFELNPPAPDWAVPRRRPAQGYSWSQRPSASEYRKFVEAVGRRYSGAHPVPAHEDYPSRDLRSVSVPIPGITTPPNSSPRAAAVAQDPIPRVDYWGLWNEPNEAAWLNPQWRTHNRHHLIAPSLYRSIVDAGWAGLHASGHRSDTILIGETASRGWIVPTPFVESLYCVGPRFRPLRGGAARNVNCPTSGNTRSFVATHPGLFDSTGYAHHPYSFDTPPAARPAFRGEVALSKLGGFEHVLNRIFAAYGKGRRAGIPLYLTEWGYKTNPPNPYVRTSLQQQASWLNQGEYITYRRPWIKSLTQFLLYDDGPNKAFRRGTRGYWGVPTTGLLFMGGKPKPSYAAYRVTIWLPRRRHGAHVLVFGRLRPLNRGGRPVATLLFRRRGGKFKPVTTLHATTPYGFIYQRVAIPGPGFVQIAWPGPNGTTYYSRLVRVS